ncbi:hypothetical protein WH47_03672 [Habropoda laboriosa]|uniref:Uncharacterized protein n=1 Tax=Habropoda laboriosa TaxID=597456 RepID=A0A0L7RIT9_9HYME|nr:hypothetical protein WH47_03672 [Habropoda laboriosa]
MLFDKSAILTVQNHVITRNPRISVSHKHRTWFLHIKEVQEDDKGKQSCVVSKHIAYSGKSESLGWWYAAPSRQGIVPKSEKWFEFKLIALAPHHGFTCQSLLTDTTLAKFYLPTSQRYSTCGKEGSKPLVKAENFEFSSQLTYHKPAQAQARSRERAVPLPWVFPISPGDAYFAQNTPSLRMSGWRWAVTKALLEGEWLALGGDQGPNVSGSLGLPPKTHHRQGTQMRPGKGKCEG